MSRSKQNFRRNPNKGPEWVQLLNWVRKTEAWRSLKPWSRLLYVELRGKYNGHNNGDISMSYREAEELLGCSNKPIANAFWELEDRGFIKPIQKGAFGWKVGKRRATTWLLTELAPDLPERGLVAEQTFKSWTAPAEKKTRHAKSGLLARQKRAIPADIARQKRAISTPKAGYFEQNAPHNSTPKAGTFIYTISPEPLGRDTTEGQPSTASLAEASTAEPLSVSAALLRTRIFLKNGRAPS